MFQKRHYQALAKLIAEAKLPARHKLTLAKAHAKLFENDNPLFDRKRFLIACGVKSK